MKKLLLAFSAVLAGLSQAAAQAPDFGFETWANVPLSTTIQDPTGWASFNVLNLVGTNQSVFKETTAPYAGTAAAKITTVKITGAAIPNPYTGVNIDTAGLLAIGSTQFTAPYIKYGKPYANRPAVLSFASKYTPVSGDTAFVIAYLTKWNGSSRDTIAYGSYSTGATTTSYAVNNITLTYNSATVMPDTEMVFISSSVFFHTGAKIGSTLYVDDLQWSGYVSTNDLNGKVNNVAVYPNPASSVLNLSATMDASNVAVFDITGRKLGVYELTNNKVKIETYSYPAGMYFYQLLDQGNKVIHTGKFQVTK